MSPDHSWDDEAIRSQLAAVVPEPPAAPDRMAQLRERRQQVRRRRAAGVVLAACLAVGAAAVAVPVALGHDRSHPPLPPVDHTPTSSPTSTPTAVEPALDCPATSASWSDNGPGTLAAGATAARLCGVAMNAPTIAPRDLLTTGLDQLVDSVNSQPKGGFELCNGPAGDSYILLVGYPDGTDRRVSLSFSACGALVVGDTNRRNPGAPYATFMDLLREQRSHETPPADVPAPDCLTQYSGFAPVARPIDMVAARMCVTYADNGRTTSTEVPADDLRTILRSWRDGPATPTQKGPPCTQTTPTWVLSGVTQWGDPVQITAECGRPSRGSDWVQLDARAQDVVDRLVALAGVRVNDGSKATSAWWLAQAWIDDVNARATVSDGQTAADIADVADSLWVGDPWLPDGGLDWYLQGATRTSAAGWQEAWRVPARTPTGEAVFVIVRDNKDDPWRILSLTR